MLFSIVLSLAGFPLPQLPPLLPPSFFFSLFSASIYIHVCSFCHFVVSYIDFLTQFVSGTFYSCFSSLFVGLFMEKGLYTWILQRIYFPFPFYIQDTLFVVLGDAVCCLFTYAISMFCRFVCVIYQFFFTLA